jgi:hypothetical protein
MEEYNMYFFHQSFNFTYNFCFSTASFSLHYVLTLPMLFQQILQPEKKLPVIQPYPISQESK